MITKYVVVVVVVVIIIIIIIIIVLVIIIIIIIYPYSRFCEWHFLDILMTEISGLIYTYFQIFDLVCFIHLGFSCPNLFEIYLFR